MTNIQQLEEITRSLGLKYESKSDGVILMTSRGRTFVISEEEVEEYLEVRDTIDRPFETAVSSLGLFEQSVEFHRWGPVRNQLARDGSDVVLERPDGSAKITIGAPSSIFALSMLDVESLPRRLRMMVLRTRARPRIQQEDQEFRITDLFRGLVSVRLEAEFDHEVFTTEKSARAVLESALFNFSVTRGVAIGLADTWERTLRQHGSRRHRGDAQFPRRTYNSELIAYYQLALGSESLILAYLAFYKILEFFFTSAAEKGLHKLLREKLVAPDFGHTRTRKLRELASVVRRFDQKMDERRMLVTVLADYLTADELRDWLISVEANEPYFQEEQQIFGKKLQVDVSDNQIHHTVAARIYHIRNTLVHHKEGEVARFVPFKGQEEVLLREIPLVDHIAEQLIVKSGKDLTW